MKSALQEVAGVISLEKSLGIKASFIDLLNVDNIYEILWI